MFTGIITDIGTIRSREDRGDARLVIGTAYDTGTIDLGASIACSGACLTVVDKGADADGHWFAIDASAETLARTAPGMWDAGRRTEEHTSALQSLMRISYAVFCLKKKNK